MKHIKGLDTLRAFAVIFVIIEHWSLPVDFDPTGDALYWIRGLIPGGGFGVNLFFVLSGFLITSILLEAVKKDGGHKFKIIKNFIIRRALRIFPVYYLTIFLLILIKYPFIQDNLSYFILYISNILIYQTRSFNPFSHTWSLSVEEQFYLIWPWFIVFVRERFLKYVFIGSILIGIATAFYTIKIERNWAGYVLMLSCMQAFGIGGFYAYLKGKNRLDLYTKFNQVALPAALVFHFYWAFNRVIADDYINFFILTDSIISIWLIHSVINARSGWVQKYILENRVLNRIGQISYGIYLFHFVMHFVYDKLVRLCFTNIETLNFLLEWKTAYYFKLVLLFLIATLSFNYFEKPILKLKDRFNY